MRLLFSTAVALAWLGLAPVGLVAQTVGPSVSFGAKAGVRTPGGIYWHEDPLYDGSYDLDIGLAGGVFFDVGAPVSVGGYADIQTVDAWDDSNLLFEAGATFKVRLGAPAAPITFRPLFGIGYARLGKIHLFEASSYLTVRGGVEVLKSQLVVEAVLYGAPYGGDSNNTLTYGPIALVRVGYRVR